MEGNSQDQVVAHALAVARVRALRLSLLALHKTLIDAERRRYERAHGRVESPHAALRLLLDHPLFQWLHPIAELIVQMDEHLAEDEQIDVARAEAFRDRVRGLLHDDGVHVEFRTEYRRVLQEAPEAVIAHAELTKQLA
jgi:hypothetical protein